MNTVGKLMVAVWAGTCFSSLGRAAVIDSFDTAGSPSSYTQTVILNGDAAITSSLVVGSGVVQVNKSAGTEPEQNLYLRSDFPLAVNQQLRVSFAPSGAIPTTGYADFGIAMGATPTAVNYNTTVGGNQSTRADYAAIYVNGSQNLLKTIAFNGTTQLTQPANINPDPAPGAGIASVTALYISRLTETTYAVGYTIGGVDINRTVYTLTNPNVANNVGLYSDVRAATTFGSLDSLQIVAIPEPSALGLVGLAALGLVRRRRMA